MIITMQELKILLDTAAESLRIGNWNGWDAKTRESIVLAVTGRLAEIKLGIQDEQEEQPND